MAKIDLDLDDLTNAALKRMVKQLLIAEDGEEEKILASLSKQQKKKKKNDDKNELADLKEETKGKAPIVEVEDDEMEDDD